MSLLQTLPNEVLLFITSFLEVPDIISLRKTCTYLARMTCDRSVWLSVVRQNRHLPLPSYLHSPSLLVETPTTSLESAIRSAHKVSKSWLLPRATNIHPAAENLHPTPGQHLILLEIFSDRWLLCVYAEGSVSLWDLDSESTSIDGQHVPAKPGYKFDRIGRDIGEENGWTSCVAALDVDEQAIMLACCRMTSEDSSSTSIYRLPFSDPTAGRGDLHYKAISPESFITELQDSPRIVRAISPTMKLVAFAHSTSIDIIHWETKQKQTIVVKNERDFELQEDDHRQWSGIIALRFFERYILSVRSYTIELCPILSGAIEPPVLRHTFKGVTVHSVSISSEHPSQPCEDEGEGMISILAYDVYHGLLHYTLRLPSTSRAPFTSALDVTLLSVYKMSATCGFVSACVLGKEGKRGMWVERGRKSTTRSVWAFCTGDIATAADDEIKDTNNGQSASIETGVQSTVDRNEFSGRDAEGDGSSQTEDDYMDGEDGSDSDEGEPVRQWNDLPAINGHLIYEVTSYDLREDLTRCAFSEVSGRIALGSRSGEVTIL